MKLKDILLTEVTKPHDIVDLYLIMLMPEPSSKAGKFTVKEVVDSVRDEIQSELEKIILRELAHSAGMSKEGLDVASGYLPEGPSKRIQRRLKEKLGIEHDKEDPMVGQMALRSFFDEFRALRYGRILQDTEKQDFKAFENHLKEHIPDIKKFGPGLVKWMFNYLEWDESFGGIPWANITEQVEKLKEARGQEDFLKQFDRVIDVVHNTGELLNKFNKYRDIRRVLDIKQHAMDPRELHQHASPDIRKLFRDPAWQKHYYAHIHPSVVGKTGRLQAGRLGAVKRALEKPPGYGSYGKGLAGAAAQRIMLGGGSGGRDFLAWMNPGQYRKLGMRDIIDGIEETTKKYIKTTLDFYKERDAQYLGSEASRQKEILEHFIKNMKDEVHRAEARIKMLKLNIKDYEKAIKDNPTATRSERLSLKEWKEELNTLENDLPYAPMIMDMIKRIIKWVEKEYVEGAPPRDPHGSAAGIDHELAKIGRLMGK